MSMEQTIFLSSVRYEQQQTRFAVVESTDGKVFCGTLFKPRPGFQYRVKARQVHHPKFGDQFDLEEANLVWPNTRMNTIAFLAHIPGSSMEAAGKIVQVVGADAVQQILQSPRSLDAVSGVSDRTKQEILNFLRQQQSFAELDAVLLSAKFTPAQISAVRAEYGGEAGKRIRSHPYRMVLDVEEVHFADADRLAMKLGVPLNSMARVQGGVLDALTVAEQSGHTWQYAWQLEALAARALGSRLPIEAALARLVEDETVVAFGSHFFLKETYIAERGIVKEIQRLVETGDPLPDFAVAAGAGGIVYSEQQRQAILRVLAEPVCVLTGGAGTGKSTVVRGIVEQYAAMYPNRTIITAAPTGKAAHRLTETTGREATTVHRMLGYVPLGSRFVPSRKKNAPLDCDFLIVDEASMLTVEMMYRVLCALEDGTKLLIVGDTQQLSAIGAGAVLRDLQSILPVAKLTEVFRQGEHSNIVQVARQVAQGEMPDFGRDCVFVECQNDLEVKEQTLKLVQKAVESGWTKDTLQVLVPRRTGDYGVEALNPPLQAYLNPNGSPAMETKRFHYRIGDKVIQRVNDYAREIVNGDLGTVEDFHGGRVFVRFSETDVISYAPYEMGQLQPAYACTVHQYQGSQAPLVILPLAENHGRMLHRNLFYTGVTRAESQCFVVGTKKALQQAVEGMEAKRQTALCRFDALLSEKEGAW